MYGALSPFSANDQDVVFTFGDFSLDETKELIKKALKTPTNENRAQKQASPTLTKSWAQAVGVLSPSNSPNLAPRSALEAEKVSNTTTSPSILAFEEALQKNLEKWDLTTPVKEMKKSGLVNQGNTCFQNVIMQSLLACPPFLNLLVAVSSQVSSNQELLKTGKMFQAWKHMIVFIREFEEPTLAQLTKQTKKQQQEVKQPIKISGYFLDLLSAFQRMRGEQEDALEFLEFVLEYLHSEYEKSGLTLPNCLLKKTNQSKNSMINSSNIIAQNGWEEVRKGRTTAVLHENPVDNIQSPINFLFKGFLRTETKQRGKKETSITIEPFHCVHLNLSNTTSTSPAGLTGTTISTTSNTGKTTTMDEMLRDAFTVEIIDETIQRHTKIETLPIVLTVHIKRFMYHPEKGPVKLQHCVQYPIEFTFPRELTNQYKEENVKYKLFAVISHHGQFVIGGHYTCVCRDNKEQWFHYDDEKVTSISEAQALTENAYMLFYIRT